MTTILLLGTTSPARLAKLLDAAVERLGLTEVVVVAGTEMDDMVVTWNARRYKLTRYYLPPLVGDVALIFLGWDGELPDCERIIWC